MAILVPMLRRFTGGIHLAEKKNTAQLPIEALPPPKKVYIHFSQHTGKPARPTVRKNDIVRVGTKIGEGDGFVSACVHSSIAGKVIALTPYHHPILGFSLCCVIEATANDKWEEDIKENQHWQNLTPKELLNIVKEAGIVGLGGAAFPTHVKLALPREKQVDTLIINGCESEPMLTADYRLMLEYPLAVVQGAKIFQKVLNTPHLILGIEDNKKNAAKILRKEGIDIRLLKTRYPQGAEKQLIKAILNREVPRDGLPLDVGCVVHNVATCYAASQAVIFQKPLVDRVITVTGDGIKEPKNVLVRIGTPAIDVINFCGGYVKQPRKIIFGGPMMGIAQYSEEVPIIKSTTGIIVWTKSEPQEEGPCVRCARCVDFCPMGLLPTELYKFVKFKNFDKAKNLGILDCIECGSCAYACPAKIPLVHYLKYGKSEAGEIL